MIFAGVKEDQRELFEERLRQVEQHENVNGVILFCSFLKTPLSQKVAPFRIVYLCRALDKLAVLRERHDGAWSVFIEIAVFEYEWIGNREETENWTPVQEILERYAFANGASVKKGSAYLETKYSGCEAGFWPFMTIVSRNVLPLDGRMMAGEAERKKAKNKSRPFGFF